MRVNFTDLIGFIKQFINQAVYYLEINRKELHWAVEKFLKAEMGQKKENY